MAYLDENGNIVEGTDPNTLNAGVANPYGNLARYGLTGGGEGLGLQALNSNTANFVDGAKDPSSQFGSFDGNLSYGLNGSDGFGKDKIERYGLTTLLRDLFNIVA